MPFDSMHLYMCEKEDKYAFYCLCCYNYHDYYLVSQAIHILKQKRCEEI